MHIYVDIYIYIYVYRFIIIYIYIYVQPRGISKTQSYSIDTLKCISKHIISIDVHACEHACDVPERKYVPGTRAVMIEFCLQFHAFVRRSKAIGCLVANWLMDVEGTCKECEATKRPSKGRRRDLTKNKFPTSSS